MSTCEMCGKQPTIGRGPLTPGEERSTPVTGLYGDRERRAGAAAADALRSSRPLQLATPHQPHSYRPTPRFPSEKLATICCITPEVVCHTERRVHVVPRSSLMPPKVVASATRRSL